MKKTIKLLSIDQALIELKGQEKPDVKKYYKTLKLVLKLDAFAESAQEYIDFFLEKLQEERFKLYLMIIMNVSKTNLMDRKKKNTLLSLLNTLIREENRSYLKTLNNDILFILDTLDELESQDKLLDFLTTDVNRHSIYNSEQEFFFRTILCLIYIKQKQMPLLLQTYELSVIKIIEREFSSLYEKINPKLFSDAILAKNRLPGLLNLSYLHNLAEKKEEQLISHLNDYKTKYDRLQETNNMLRETQQCLVSEKMQLKIELSESKLILENSKKKVEDLEYRIQSEIQRSSNENRVFQTQFKDEFYRTLRLEIDGLSMILNHIESPEKERLERRIANLKKMVDRED